jgi:hypothetical protein
MRTPDVLVRWDGSVWAVDPLTPAAQEFFKKYVVVEPWQVIGTSIIVDHRMFPGLIQGIHDAKLKVA